MTEEFAQGLWDLIQGQERLMDVVEALAEDSQSKAGKGARAAAIPSVLATHRQKTTAFKTHLRHVAPIELL